MSLVQHPPLQDRSGRYLRGRQVSAVAEAATGDPATAYADSDGTTPVSYPVVSGSEGEVELYVATGTYLSTFGDDTVDNPARWEAVSGDDVSLASGVALNALEYQGTWDAAANTPTLADNTGTNGSFYKVSTSGTRDLGSGSQTFNVGDFVLFEDGEWTRIAARNGGLVFKDVIDCSANPSYPAAITGDLYRVSVAGRIGGGSGPKVEVADLLLCVADTASGTHGSVGSNWVIEQGNIDGAVIGPSSATDADLAQFDGTTGKLLKGGLALDTDGTLAANSDSKAPSQKAVKTYADGLAKPGAWTTLTPGTDWANVGGVYNDLAYRKVGDKVELRGVVKRASGTGTTIGTLPAGARPAKQILLPGLMASGSTLARVEILTTGVIQYTAGTVTGFLGLDAIDFSTV